jgi:hypothetical protein
VGLKMTDKDIFIKVIKQAQNKGYTRNIPESSSFFFDFEDYIGYKDAYFSIIFSHDFAKAFFGDCTQWMRIVDGEPIDTISKQEKEEYEDDYMQKYTTFKEIDGWKHHLQQMVLEKEPLKYLEQFL